VGDVDGKRRRKRQLWNRGHGFFCRRRRTERLASEGRGIASGKSKQEGARRAGGRRSKNAAAGASEDWGRGHSATPVRFFQRESKSMGL